MKRKSVIVNKNDEQYMVSITEENNKTLFRVKRYGTRHVSVLVPREIRNYHDAIDWFIRVNPAVRIEP